MRALLVLSAASLCAACAPSGSDTSADTPARLAAEAVAESLSTQVGTTDQGVGLSSIRVSGESVITTFTLPTPGEGADPAFKATLSQGIAQSFGPQVCSEGGIAELYAAGGDMVIRVEGSDGVVIADLPAECA